MQLVANQQLVKNRVRLGLGFHISALAVFALGLVLSIYVHEMGHVIALRRYGP